MQGSESSEGPQNMGSESKEKKILLDNKKRRSNVALSCLLTVALLLILKVYVNQDEFKLKMSVIAFEQRQAREPPAKVDFNSFKDCRTSFQPPPPKAKGEWSTKPLWLASHPNSLEDNTHRNLVNSITGLNAGGKSFYASSRPQQLRQCFGVTETATCSNIHPIIEMGNGGPEGKQDVFFQQYIMAIRNPRTVLPAFHNGKAIKYHGVKGQVPEEDWRKHRDEQMQNMMDGYKVVLKTWKSLKNYQVGMYIVYEHLLDLQKGPALLLRLARLLRQAGFVTAPDEDIPCMWYRALGRPALEQYRSRGYEYEGYIPGYTKAQRDLMMRELSSLMADYSDDPDLVSILKEYHDDIRDNTRIDREWVNKTSVS